MPVITLDSRAAFVLCYPGYFAHTYIHCARAGARSNITGETRGKGVNSDMFAVVETGGKQYKVSPGQTVAVEKLPAEPGDTVELGRVLLISTDDQTFVGAPVVEDAKIVARVADLQRGPKIIVFRYKSKSRYRRKTGHRQDYSILTIEDIWAHGASLLPPKEETEAKPEEEEVPAAAEEAAEAEAIEAAATEEQAVEAEDEAVEAAAAEAAAPEPAPEAPRPEPKRGRRRAPKTEEKAEGEA